MNRLWAYLDALPYWYVPTVILTGLAVLGLIDFVASRRRGRK